jgi:hypothetical protein
MAADEDESQYIVFDMINGPWESLLRPSAAGALGYELSHPTNCFGGCGPFGKNTSNISFSIGLVRVPIDRPGGRWVPRFCALFGLGFLIDGISRPTRLSASMPASEACL